MTAVASPNPSDSTWSGRKGATWRSGTASTTAWAPRWLVSRASWRWDRSSGASPGSASPASVPELHWGHGDGLVLRGLSELPVIPGPALPK